jgi:1,2-diacylglycerol 3-alpha-glucosyltransferase
VRAASGIDSDPRPPLRALYFSDVYFPRVNGVSTSIATFRAELPAQGVETVLVAPGYGGEAVEAGVRAPARTSRAVRSRGPLRDATRLGARGARCADL